MLGSAVGAIMAVWLFPAPIPSPAISAPPPLTRPSPTPIPEWAQWLSSEVPVPPGLDTDGFWSILSPLAGEGGLDPRQRVALEEGLWRLTLPELLAVVSDPRFASLTDPMEPRWRLSWTNLLLKAGFSEAMKAVDSLPSASLREDLRSAVLEKLVLTDPEAGFDWILNQPYHHNPVADYLETLAHLDVAKATELWERLDSDSGRDVAGLRILKALLDHDWKSAFDWARANASPEWKSQYVRYVFEGLRPNQREGGLAVAHEITDPALRSLAYTGLLMGRLRGAPMETVLDEALALPAGLLNAEGWGELGRACASYKMNKPEPTATADHLKALAARLPHDGREAFLKHAAALAAVNDPTLASHLFEFLTPGTSRTMAEKWANRNPTAASAWLATLPTSPHRDEAVAGFCRGIAHAEPAAAAEWALTLPPGPLRDQTIQHTLTTWHRLDPENAAAWSAAHAAPDE